MKTAALSGGGSCLVRQKAGPSGSAGSIAGRPGPQLVEAALDLERRSHADVAVEAFAVVADLLHDIDDPGLVDAERLAHARGDAEDALDRGFSLFSISSTFFEVMPYSSASSMALNAQRTISANWLSPWRTAGPTAPWR